MLFFSGRKLNRSTSCGEKYSLKSESENMKSRSGGKPRISFARKKVDFGFTRSMEKSDISDWDVYFKNRQNRADEGYSTSDTNVEEEKEDKHLAKLVAKFDRSIEALWNDESENCDNQNEYQDLPVDLQELLASPTVEILNNNKKTVNNKSFIQCGTNITSSIWSDYSDDNKSLYDSYCNLYNESLEADKILGDQFNYLNIDKNIQENETNLLYENLDNNNLKTDYLSLPWELSYPIDRLKWSSAENLDTNPPFKRVSKQVNESLITLNHNEEESCFKEVVPKQVLGLTTFTAGGPALASLPPEAKEQEEDLLTSARTHFRPIKQEDTQQGYADGTTFAIRSSLERVNYKRSESGMLLLESEFDTPKKYMEYRLIYYNRRM